MVKKKTSAAENALNSKSKTIKSVSEKNNNPFLIVGMGASAGGLEDKNLVYTSVADKGTDFHLNSLIEKKDSDFFSKEDAQKLEIIKKRVLKTKKPYRNTISLMIRGALKHHELTVRPIIVDSKITGISCTTTDISDLFIAEKQLEEIIKKTNGN
jgi:two-component system, chemotaxis family, CheB/CheR fusion protein